MTIKERLKFQIADEEGKVSKFTVTVSGRTREELTGRIANVISRQGYRGATLR